MSVDRRDLVQGAHDHGLHRPQGQAQQDRKWCHGPGGLGQGV